jgi:hypothetical protein
MEFQQQKNVTSGSPWFGNISDDKKRTDTRRRRRVRKTNIISSVYL